MVGDGQKAQKVLRSCCLGEATLLTFLAQPPGAQAAGSDCSALRSVKGSASSMGRLSRFSPAIRSGARASLAPLVQRPKGIKGASLAQLTI